MKQARKGLRRGAANALRRSPRWTGARNDTYMAVLAETGNLRAAAEAIGMDRSTLRHRRRSDPAFDAACTAAIAAADERLAGDPEVELDPFEAIRRGSDGRLRIVAVGKGQWTSRTDRQYLDLLRATGNMSASARALGFTPETVWERRRKWPAFAAAIDAMLEEAELELELRLAVQGNDVAPGEDGAAPPPAPPFDREFALKFLKWREEKRTGRGRRGRGDRPPRKEPSIEEVRDEVLRRIAAIRRHREKYGESETKADGGP